MKDMKSYVFGGDKKIKVVNKPIPEPKDGQVLIKTKTSSICGTDLHVYRSPASDVPSGGVTTSGHEPVGEVVAVGAGITWPKVGERVVGYHVAGCGVCKFCQLRRFKECAKGYSAPASNPEKIAMGETLDGSNAEYILLDAGLVLPLPDDFSYAEGSVLCCNFGTAYGAVRNAFVFPGGTLAVWGLGPVGLNMITIAKAFGLRIIGVDVSESRRKIAAALGVEVVDGALPDLTQRIQDLTGGEGPDSIIDTSGVPSVHEILIPTVKRRGTVVLIGIGHNSMIGPVPQAVLRQVTVKGSWIFDIEDWHPMLQFVRDHQIDLFSVIDEVVPVADFEDAFDRADRALAGKIVFDWDGADA